MQSTKKKTRKSANVIRTVYQVMHNAYTCEMHGIKKLMIQTGEHPIFVQFSQMFHVVAFTK